MMRPPRLLLITNDPQEGLALGPVEGFELLAAKGQLGQVKTVSHAAGGSADRTRRTIIDALKTHRPDIVLVWTGIAYPATLGEQDELAGLLTSKTVLFWEGDPWGGRKRPSDATRWWLERADLAFSVAGEPQISMLTAMGARAVQFIPHTYSHIQFARAVDTPPGPPEECPYDIAMVAGNYSRIPGVTGMPGSFDRFRLAASMKLSLRARFRVYGRGWPKWISGGTVPYADQIESIRDCRLSVNWDHFPHHEYYASDRLAISLLSGRPHVTTGHPGMEWAPDESLGIFHEPTVRAVRARACGLLSMDAQEVHQLGLDAWRWVRNRMSNKEGARFMMSMATDTVPPLTTEPWTRLPAVKHQDSLPAR